MIKIKQIFIILLSLLLLISFASADISIENDKVILDVDYKYFKDDNQKGIDVETNQFTLKNNGTANATITLTIDGLPADYSYTNKDVEVPANSSLNVKLLVNVTHSKDPGEVKIGTIKAVSGIEEKTVDLFQNTKKMLNFKEINIKYRNEEDKSQDEDLNADTDDSFDLDEDVKIGSKMTIKVEIENLFDDDEYDDSKLDNIELKIDASPNDVLPDGFDDKIDFSNLRADKDDVKTIEIDIPEDADADDYTLEFKLSGEDGQNIDYEIIREISFSLKRKDDDIRITKAEISSSEITACDSSFAMEVELKNFGNDDQKDVNLAIYNRELDLNEKVSALEINEYDDDDSWSKVFQLPIKEGVNVKKYPLEITTFIDKDTRQDSKIVELNLEKCETTVAPTPPPSAPSTPPPTTTAPVQGTSTTSTQTTTNANTAVRDTTTTTSNTAASNTANGSENSLTGNAVRVIEEPYTSNDLVTGGLVIAIVLVLAVIVVFITILLRG